MKHWIVTRKSDAAVVYRYQADVPVEWQGMEFTTHDHMEEVVPEPEPEAPVDVRRVTKLGFRNRFTMSEKATLEIAALDVPTAPMAARAQAAGLRATMKDQEVAQYIDLLRPETRAGVQQLEMAGLIGPGRAAQILDGPIADVEVWRG